MALVPESSRANASTGVTTDGWTSDIESTWTRASASTFTTAGDRTSEFRKGTRLRFTQTTVKYGTVASASHAAGTTTVTIIVNTEYVLADAAITANSYSNEQYPSGWPGWFTYAPTVSGFSGSPTVTAAQFSTVGNTVWVMLSISGTSNAVTFTVTTPVAAADALGFAAIFVTDNSSNQAAPGRIDVGVVAPTEMRLGKTMATAGGFTGSGTKGTVASVFYEM